MANKFMMCAVSLAALTLSASATDIVLRHWRTSEPLTVKTPFLNDSVDVKGDHFRSTQLLHSRVQAKLPKTDKILQGDTLTFAAPTADGALRVLQTDIRASRFSGGTLKVTSQVPFTVLLDDREVITKESVQRDSLSGESTASTHLRLEPEKDYTLTVKLLTFATDSVAPNFSACFTPDEKCDSTIEFSAGPDIKHRYTLDDSQYASRVTGMWVSPNGRYLITGCMDYYSKDNYRYYHTLTDLRSGKVINPNLAGGTSWMPRSNKLYRMVRQADGYDLITIDPETGAETVAFRNMPTDRFTWSPNEKTIYYTTDEPGKREDGPLRRYLSPDDRMPGNRNRQQLMTYDTATGLSQQLTFGNHSVSINDITEDGSRLLCTTMQDDPTRRPFYSQTIYTLDVNTFKADTLVDQQPMFINNAVFSPDGKQVLLIGSASAFDCLGKNCGDHPIANDYDVQAYIMDLSTKKVKAISRDFNPNILGIVCWNQEDGRIYFRCEEGFYNRIYAYNPKDGKFTQVPTEVNNVGGVAMGDKSANYIAYWGGGYLYNSRGYVYNTKSGKATKIAEPNADHLADINFGKVEPWKFTASDGTTIDGIICYPPDFDASKSYPLIVYYYGGTSPTQCSITTPYSAQLFAARDYVVYALNPSGTTGYGQEFSARHVNAWGKYTAADIIEGVKKFTAAHPFVDPKRIGCIGASYGGFMTQYLQTQTDIFAAAVSHAGISAVTSYWGEGYWGYSYNSVAAADSYPWTDADLFTKQGSLFNADKIHTPLLLLHGTADTNVPMGESIQLFNALRILGRDVEFISVDGEDHFISDYSKRQLWHNSIMAWFAKYLQGDDSWWSELYPDSNVTGPRR